MVHSYTADVHPDERKYFGGNYKLGDWVLTIIND